ncbi:uncharacterized protein PG986_001461 [Apiospora aurea]|uniref:Uncharacterized protein n=1 Tax=Apiospora aurea TaxID=335848 RepID=A0ABR1QX27_9PEZI
MMTSRSTFVRLAATARQWGPALRQSQPPAWRLRGSRWPTRGIKHVWVKHTQRSDEPHDEPTVPVQQQGDQARPALLPSDRASLDAALGMKHVEVEAWKHDGKHALDVLDGLCLEPHDVQAIPKAIKCLEAYKHSIQDLSVDDAKATIARDEAGNRVVQWFETEAINQQIKGNHPENRALLQLISDILIGADRLPKLESWIRTNSRTPKGVTDKRALFIIELWKGNLYANMFNSLVWWHPDGAQDDAMDYLSNSYEYMLHDTLNMIPHVQAKTRIMGIMKNPDLVCLDPRSFDRYLASFERHMFLTRDFSVRIQFDLAGIKMVHPFHPDPYPFLDFLGEVLSDPLHTWRFYAIEGRKRSLSNYYYFLCTRAEEILASRGRAQDAEWIFPAYDKLFGRDVDTFWGKDPLSAEVRPLSQGPDSGPPFSEAWTKKLISTSDFLKTNLLAQFIRGPREEAVSPGPGLDHYRNGVVSSDLRA